MSTLTHRSLCQAYKSTRRTGPASLRSPHSPDDADLIALVRGGDHSAFSVLSSRHADAARKLAGDVVPGSRSARDMLVAAAFQAVLAALDAGVVLETTFRGYLLATLREVAATAVSDAALIDAVREGDLEVYGALYARHVAAAYNLARQLTRSQAQADDLVADAFAKVLEALKEGRGPDSAFRAYLLTALRNTAYDKTRRDKRLDLSEDVEGASGVKTEAVSQPFVDTVLAGLERSLATQAFERLPERWQAVLWHTEVEGQSPAKVAPILGLTPNGVSALAYRAREALKQAYLQVHLAEVREQRCRTTVDRLGAWTRDGLCKRERAQIESHLDECDPCRALTAELADLNPR